MDGPLLTETHQDHLSPEMELPVRERICLALNTCASHSVCASLPTSTYLRSQAGFSHTNHDENQARRCFQKYIHSHGKRG